MAAGATDAVSTGIFESLFWLYMAIAAIVGALVLGWLGYIMVKFRWRPDQERPRDAPKAGVLPAERGHPIWSYVMAVVIAGIMFGLAFGTISAVTTLETPPPDEEHLHVDIIGFQFGWRMTYAGEGGVPIARIQDWTVPVDTAIVANVTSQDVWHNFALPTMRMRIDAIPGETTHIWWKAHETGTIEPVCVQICGVGHALMKTQMHIVGKEEFAAYLTKASQEEYAKLEKRGGTSNLTFTGSGFEGNTIFTAAKPFAVRVVNQGDAEQAFTLDGNAVTLAAGESGFVYSRGTETSYLLEATGAGATATFRSVS